MRASWPTERGEVIQTCGGSMFTGVVWGETWLPHVDGNGVNRVTFAPGSRTFWHRHHGGQMLIGCAGSGLVVTRDGVQAIGEGAVVHASPAEVHWHGALPEAFMSHQSVVMGGQTEWLEEVTEQDYLAAVATLHPSLRR
jgi:quercetin dioxygenase-like cupin family protein